MLEQVQHACLCLGMITITDMHSCQKIRVGSENRTDTYLWWSKSTFSFCLMSVDWIPRLENWIPPYGAKQSADPLKGRRALAEIVLGSNCWAYIGNQISLNCVPHQSHAREAAYKVAFVLFSVLKPHTKYSLPGNGMNEGEITDRFLVSACQQHQNSTKADLIVEAEPVLPFGSDNDGMEPAWALDPVDCYVTCPLPTSTDASDAVKIRAVHLLAANKVRNG